MTDVVLNVFNTKLSGISRGPFCRAAYRSLGVGLTSHRSLVFPSRWVYRLTGWTRIHMVNFGFGSPELPKNLSLKDIERFCLRLRWCRLGSSFRKERSISSHLQSLMILDLGWGPITLMFSSLMTVFMRRYGVHLGPTP